MDLIRPKKDYCDKSGSKDAIRIADGIAVAVVALLAYYIVYHVEMIIIF